MEINGRLARSRFTHVLYHPRKATATQTENFQTTFVEMWLLECEGDVLAGKKLWLKPGKKYVLGRVPSEEGMRF